MPFKPTPGFIIIFIVALLIIVGVIAAVASGGGSKPGSQPGTAKCTVDGEVGVAYIRITYVATNTSITKTFSDLPYTFRFTKDEPVRFTVVTLPDYTFNAWSLDTGTFDNHNPLIIKVARDVTLTAECLIKGGIP